MAWTAVLAVVFIISGAHVALRDAVESLAAGAPAALRPSLAVTAFTVALVVLQEIAGLPFAWYGGFAVERRYGLSKQTPGSWLFDQVKAVGVAAILGGPMAAVLYAFIRRFPDAWWLLSGVVFALLFVGLANLAPVVLLPLFYRITPLTRAALRARLVTLADRAGAKVLGAYEWGLGEKSSKANAALTGLAGTRRILVSDTMLADYSDDEIEVVLAHELGHHVHGDIWKSLVFESLLMLAGFFAASRVLGTLGPRLGLRDAADVAGLPALLLTAGVVSVAALPAARALSRAHERRADRFALGLTRNPEAFVSAMRRLAAQNLAEEKPGKIVEWLFHSHPPIQERIEAARRFR